MPRLLVVRTSHSALLELQQHVSTDEQPSPVRQAQLLKHTVDLRRRAGALDRHIELAAREREPALQAVDRTRARPVDARKAVLHLAGQLLRHHHPLLHALLLPNLSHLRPLQ